MTITIRRTQYYNSWRKREVSEPEHGYYRYPRHCKDCYNAWQRMRYAALPKGSRKLWQFQKDREQYGEPGLCECPHCTHRKSKEPLRRQRPIECAIIPCDCCGDSKYHTWVICYHCGKVEGADGSCECYECLDCSRKIPQSKTPHGHCPECKMELDNGICPWKREQPETHPSLARLGSLIQPQRGHPAS